MHGNVGACDSLSLKILQIFVTNSGPPPLFYVTYFYIINVNLLCSCILHLLGFPIIMCFAFNNCNREGNIWVHTCGLPLEIMRLHIINKYLKPSSTLQLCSLNWWAGEAHVSLYAGLHASDVSDAHVSAQ